MRSFAVEIPVPPSLNNVYGNARRSGGVRYAVVGNKVVAKKSAGAPRYMKEGPSRWKNGAIQLIKSQVRPSERIGGPVSIKIEVPTGTLGDIDNRIKLAVDCLVTADRIDDDRNMHACSIVRGDVRGVARITVTEIV